MGNGLNGPGRLCGMAMLLALLVVASGCQRADKVDPELGRQTVLTGSVTLSDGEEPSNVGVVARLRDEAAVTDSASTGVDGRFRIVGLPPGEYDVDATKEGYFTATKFVQLNEGLVSELASGSSAISSATAGWIPAPSRTCSTALKANDLRSF